MPTGKLASRMVSSWRPHDLGPLPAPVRRALSSRIVTGLTTPRGVSHYLGAIHPLWSLEGGRALVTGVSAETADMVTLTLRPDHEWQGFRAGQHIRIGIQIDGTLRTRTYSVSCSQHRADGHLTITVKRKDGGLVSGYLTTNVQVGDVLACSPATGDVVLPDPRPDRLVLISGGSGITPMGAMLRTLADEDHTGQVTFIHYARTNDDVAFLGDLRSIESRLPNAEVAVVLTAPARGRVRRGDDPAGTVHGRFAVDHLDVLAPDHLDVPTFVCGPTGLVDAVEQHYEAHGATDRLQVERFTPPALRSTGGPGEGTVRFAASDIEVADDGRTLLDQAESAGLTPEFGCRMGICRTCTVQKVAGGSTDLRNGRRSDIADEQVQLCISVACGDVVLDL